ncbi:MAG: SIS domain-containing protein [Acidimicrobiia bacterium]
MNLYAHLDELAVCVDALRDDIPRLEVWGTEIALALGRGGRLLAAGNGGSAAQAQHLTSELVGRFTDERRPLSAIALHADTSALTALVNDYGADEMYARSVRAHGRSGDVLVILSTSGRSANVVRAAEVAIESDLLVLALTGPAPSPLADLAHASVCVDALTPTVQEVHQIAIHLLCAAVDARLALTGGRYPEEIRP